MDKITQMQSEMDQMKSQIAAQQSQVNAQDEQAAIGQVLADATSIAR